VNTSPERLAELRVVVRKASEGRWCDMSWSDCTVGTLSEGEVDDLLSVLDEYAALKADGDWDSHRLLKQLELARAEKAEAELALEKMLTADLTRDVNEAHDALAIPASNRRTVRCAKWEDMTGMTADITPQANNAALSGPEVISAMTDDEALGIIKNGLSYQAHHETFRAYDAEDKALSHLRKRLADAASD